MSSFEFNRGTRFENNKSQMPLLSEVFKLKIQKRSYDTLCVAEMKNMDLS
jgi:hypothetical protein